ncbi:hypothetical protein JVX90_18050 [Gordonia sp. PDNC005]|uniref:type IV toxin-antitoxin system AbiEi family antitoxin domain-containing protein n=1 Tax=unclassified Gordonia (in: high G+C Gram-positive bacteria) TaxID=2657482 RepID=UPI0019659F28|nr:type IV toxin-antitoxin system AbiEi family antitoxin domain-containing protein [Gordonia sp. PDNC005]QRY62261.1 hypothetical protein JVX90_18050 [Gordonia sp. PDNC005]
MRDAGIRTRAQLHAEGLADTDIRRMVETGTLTRLRPGWFALGAHDLRAATAVQDGGVLGCVSALQFHGLWVPPGHTALHLRRSPKMTGKNAACRPFQGPLRSTVDAVDSIPIALKYAAHCLEVDEWVAVCDSHLNSTGETVGDLLAQMGAVGPTVRDLAYRTDPRAQSGTESITRVRLRAAHFSVVVQPRIAGIDWSDLRIGKLILECDSVLHHSSREDYERDHHRDRRALLDGWLTMRLTYDDILYDWPGTLADIRAITRADRHRARSARDQAMVLRSLRSSGHEGNMPPWPDF